MADMEVFKELEEVLAKYDYKIDTINFSRDTKSVNIFACDPEAKRNYGYSTNPIK